MTEKCRNISKNINIQKIHDLSAKAKDFFCEKKINVFLERENYIDKYKMKQMIFEKINSYFKYFCLVSIQSDITKMQMQCPLQQF